MITRILTERIIYYLNHFSSVAILGPRQSGKTTLAQGIASQMSDNVIYLDLEKAKDIAQLSDPELYFHAHKEKLIILDEVQRIPNLFMTLRGTIDTRRMAGNKTGQFLFLGSASGELLKQSSESLAGRVIYTELSGFTPLEVNDIPEHTLWLRGGFPDSFLATAEGFSLIWRNSFIQSYLEREIPQLSYYIPAEILRRLWTMLAHTQGGILNLNTLSLSMGISVPTVNKYLSILSDLFLIRFLRPYYVNIGKRLIKSPKTYIRDSGIAHALLNITSISDLLSHPISGASFEGFVIENILSVIAIKHSGTVTSWYYRTVAGAEIDLLLVYPDGKKIGIEIKLSMSPKPSKGFYTAYQDLDLSEAYVVYPGNDCYPLSENINVMSLKAILGVL